MIGQEAIADVDVYDRDSYSLALFRKNDDNVRTPLDVRRLNRPLNSGRLNPVTASKQSDEFLLRESISSFSMSVVASFMCFERSSSSSSDVRLQVSICSVFWHIHRPIVKHPVSYRIEAITFVDDIIREKSPLVHWTMSDQGCSWTACGNTTFVNIAKNQVVTISVPFLGYDISAGSLLSSTLVGNQIDHLLEATSITQIRKNLEVFTMLRYMCPGLAVAVLHLQVEMTKSRSDRVPPLN